MEEASRTDARGDTNFMKHLKAIFAVLSLFLITACASEQPKPDPIKEELTILQKQFLELQKIQNETKTKLDESTATINTLSGKLQTLEERQAVRAVSQAQIASKQTGTSPDKKTTAKKKIKKKTKKKVRRRE